MAGSNLGDSNKGFGLSDPAISPKPGSVERPTIPGASRLEGVRKAPGFRHLSINPTQ